MVHFSPILVLGCTRLVYLLSMPFSLYSAVKNNRLAIIFGLISLIFSILIVF